ncbi:MAG: hypothetical protein HZB39_05040 [Planctomycetes bacterium]|nr:hypothetical protein [Planctomycetota bacterium]
MTSSRGIAVVAVLAALPIGGALLEAGDDAASLPPYRASAVDDHPFLLSMDCEPCHSNDPNATAMRDSAGREIGMFEMWRGTMMANSGRDPYWRAGVSAEIALIPSRRSEIEEKCTRCHTPMASSAHGASNTERHWAPGKDATSIPLSDFALDGVSCAVCHAILPDGLGTRDSFTGGFWIDDQDRLFGPHAVTLTAPMFSWTLLTATQANHTAEDSGLCGSCHTLFTHTVRLDGSATGHEYPEQTPYLEWRNSVFQDEVAPVGPRAADCQDCHLPTTSVDGVPIQTRIARSPGGFEFQTIPARSPYGRHTLVGGNTLIPQILRDNAAALRVAAPASAFDATIAATRAQLRNDTADVSVPSVMRHGASLDVRVRVENRTGHKFPSGYPSRRAWLRVTVTDAAQNLVWRSGHWDTQGRILGNNGQPLASEAANGPLLLHKDLVVDPDDPQVWELAMADEHGASTFRLLRAATNLKDDRFLPAGWSPTHPDAAVTAPVGVAGDPNFTGGADEVTYRVFAPHGAGPYRIDVELWYQAISARWAAELFTVNTPEVSDFRGYWNAADRSPELVDAATATAH